jgi:hypothetical protein
MSRLTDAVHYVMRREQLRLCECRAAFVARVRPAGERDLCVLVPMAVGYQRVPHDPDGNDGTWHETGECRWADRPKEI